MIDALRGIAQYVYASILQMVFRRALQFREFEIMIPEKALLKHTVIIYVLLLLLLLLIL
jgi:positive regulator of sigma E activity